MVFARFGLILGCLFALGCGSSTDHTGETGPGPSGGGSAGAGGIDGDAGADVVLDAWGDHPNPDCSGLPGPTMVRVPVGDAGAFCIDSTEVTMAQYAQWLATGPDLSQQPAECSWNTTATTIGVYPPAAGHEEWPATSVDWCDAKAYCAWAGKRLCGTLDGGSLSTVDVADPLRNMWLYACSDGGTRPYPYGEDFVESACVNNTWPDESVFDFHVYPVKSAPACEGGVPGLFDMVGNAEEWIDACEGSEADSSCMTVGGSVQSVIADQLGCSSSPSELRDFRGGTVGFRCCADLP